MRCLPSLRDAWANCSCHKLASHIGEARHLFVFASISFGLLLTLGFFILRPLYAIPDKYHTNAATGTSTASESSITLASTNTDTSVVLTPGAGFTLSTSSNTSSYDVTTNNYTGYTITLTSEDNDKTLVHTVDNTKVISSITTPIAETDFVSTTSGLMNHFGIKPNKYYDTENNTTIDNTVSSTILPAPGTTGLILDKTTSSNSTANNYSIALGAMVDGTIPAGDYTRDTILTVIPNPIYYTINYDKNTDDTVTNLPTSQSANTTETSITLSSLVPVRSGYDFIGWCSTTTTTTNNTDSCAGTIYNPEGEGTDLTYGIDQTTTNTTTLRAMWIKRIYMQDVTPESCPSVATVVYDSRDNTPYTIQKLADDKCWLLDNLALDITNPTVLSSLSESNTNASATSLTSLRSGNRAAGPQYAIEGVIPSWGDTYSYSTPMAATSGPGWTKDTTEPFAMEQPGSGKVGVYYNFCAASAGSNCYGHYSSAGTVYADATEDICPKGWRMPTGFAAGEYQALYNAYSGSAAAFASALRLPLSGYFDMGLIDCQGDNGVFWASSKKESGFGSNAFVNDHEVEPYNDEGSIVNGYSVRCVADTLNPYLISYSKNTADTVSNMPSSQSGTANTVRKPVLSSNTPTREHYSFLGWCDAQPTSSNGVDSCGGTTYAPGSTYPVTAGTPSITLHAMWKIDTFTCTKQYRLENADGTWGSYTTDATETVNYGGSCSYSKTISDYKNAANGTNNAAASTSASNITEDTTLSLDFYRNTYELTVSAGANTSSATGSGTYRWGQTVAVGVTKATDVTCTSHAAPTWTATAGTAPAAGASSSYTMPSSNATVTATSAASNVAQTITLSRTGGASGIVIDGTNQTGSSIGLYCGNHTISGSYTSGYEFSSWAVSGGVSVASTSTASTTMTVSGPGTLTLNGKQSCATTVSGTMQDFNPCSSVANGTTGTLTDSRGGSNKSYTVAKIDGLWWTTTNLDLPGGTVLTPADSNVPSSGYTLPASRTSADGGVTLDGGFNDNTAADVYNSGSTTCASGSPCYSYYSYAAATAGTNPSSGNATYDICPKGWRLPTQAELTTLKDTYTTGATLTAAPWYGVYAGYYNLGSFRNGGSDGYYWSSRVVNVSNAYTLYFSSSFATVRSNSKNRGVSIRCVTP